MTNNIEAGFSSGGRSSVEVMAPVGSWEALHAALQAGCDSIYFGIEQLNMRARAANNMTIDDLNKISKICRQNTVKTYLTVNTILYDHDIFLMKKIIKAAKDAGITAIIASDVAAMQYCKDIGICCHISTQANVTNIETVKFYAQFADVIVTARELTLKQVAYIVKKIQEQNIKGQNGELIRIEIFAHGALCVAVSGKCYMSLHTYNASANRGACLQNCRRDYIVTDKETGEELIIENEYIMSPKDLCTIDFLDKIIATGVRVLKLEGRGRSPDYVYTVTKCYREAVEAIEAGTYTLKKIEAWKEQLSTVFNRGFWDGYYLGRKLGKWSNVYGSQATKIKNYKGKINNWFGKAGAAEIHLEAGDINAGDELLITGTTTGIIYATADSIFVDDKQVINGKKGQDITVQLPQKVRRNDKVYVLKKE